MELSSKTERGIRIWEEAMKLTEIELEVVGFMEDLRVARIRTFPAPEYPVTGPRRFPFGWGSKRRRSAIDQSPSPPRTGGGLPSLSPPRKLKVDGGESPATTLAFLPSESEEKVSVSKAMKIVSLSKLPKKIEDLQNLCDSLSTQKQALLQEIAKGLSLREKLKEEQSILLKQRLSSESESEPPATSLSLDFTLAQPAVADQDPHRHRRASVLSPCPGGGFKEDLFDLNVVPAEEVHVAAVETVVVSVEMAAAAARRNRMERKLKIQSKSCKFRALMR